PALDHWSSSHIIAHPLQRINDVPARRLSGADMRSFMNSDRSLSCILFKLSSVVQESAIDIIDSCSVDVPSINSSSSSSSP
ncbi:hypothetical protein PFISCL1PPCAC_26870, partial [Pristionchus fissidentatus]